VARFARDWGRTAYRSAVQRSIETSHFNKVEEVQQISVDIPNNVRVKFTTEQGIMAQMGSKGIALLFL
jgi:hypothetical protein